MTTDAQPTDPTRCEWCGAEYDAEARPPHPPHPRPPAAAPPGGEPLTHCEWCGAEYPVPDDRAGGAETR